MSKSSASRRIAKRLAPGDASPRALDLLRDNEQIFRGAFDNMAVGMVVASPDGRLIQPNRAFCKFLGYREKDLIGRTVESITHPEDRAITTRRIRQARPRGPITHCLQKRYIRADGQVVWGEVTSSLVCDARGQPQCIIVYVLDITERMRAQDALRQSEGRYRQVLETMNEGLVVVDARMRMSMVNDRFCRMLGYQRGELLGRTGDLVMDPAQGRIAWQQFRRRRRGIVEPYELTFTRKDGTRMPCLIAPARVVDAAGRFAGSIVIVTDVSQLKRTEEALRASNLQFNRLIDANIIGVIVGEGTRIDQANDLYLRMVGHTRRELRSGQVDWKERTPPEYTPVDQALTREMLATGVGSPREKEYFRKDGSRVPVLLGGALLSASPFRWSCFVLGLTRIKAVEAALRKAQAELETRVQERTADLVKANEELRKEIVERRRAEAAVRESEEKYRQLFAMESDALMLVDVKTRRFIEVNESACRLYGYTREEFLRTRQLDVAADRVVSGQSVRELIRTGRARVPLRLHRRKDRTLFPVEIAADIFVLRGRRVICMAIRDISDRVRGENALRLAHGRIVAARDEERRTLSRELHDSVGQKLIALGLRLNVAAREFTPNLDPSAAQALAQVSHQYHQLVKEVRDVSRTLYPATLEAMGLPAALRQLRNDLGTADVQVAVRCAKSLKNTRFAQNVEIALYRIAQEAMSNAIRHGKSKRVDVALEFSRGGLRLTVTDDGKGFNPDRAGNNGLGLISMRERAETIGAELRFASRPGRTCVDVGLTAAKRS